MTRHKLPEPVRELTTAQDAALALLIGGASDQEAAEAGGVTSADVRTWATSDPAFIAEGNRRRQATWANQADRLRALVPKAIDALAGNLASEDDRTRHTAALAILRAANWQGGRDLCPRGPTTAAGVRDDGWNFLEL